MENESLNVETIEIPTPISITFENRCYNCKRIFISSDYSYSYCPYCGDKSIHDTEVTLRIPEEAVRKIEEKERKE